MKKLLIAYDGSPASDAAISDLMHAALPDRLEALVMSVADVYLPAVAPADDAGTGPVASSVTRKAYEKALAAVEAHRSQATHLCARLQKLFPGWTCHAEAAGDSPSWAVLHKATEWKADLVVVGSQSHTRLEQFFLGSVSHRIAAEAPCSVRIGRPRVGKEELRVVVAMDGSVDSRAALQAVATRAWPRGTRFRLMTVVDPRLETAVAWPGFFPAEFSQSRTEDARQWINHMAEAAAGILDQAGLTVSNYIYDGNPKDVLLHESAAWDADAIFLGAHGLQHGGRYTLGTVASAVATRARCSVELVRKPVTNP